MRASALLPAPPHRRETGCAQCQGCFQAEIKQALTKSGAADIHASFGKDALCFLHNPGDQLIADNIQAGVHVFDLARTKGCLSIKSVIFYQIHFSDKLRQLASLALAGKEQPENSILPK